MIPQDLIGHTVQCVECHTESIVPLNAFTLAGSVVAREKPTTSGPNNKAEKKGRTQKERKSNADARQKVEPFDNHASSHLMYAPSKRLMRCRSIIAISLKHCYSSTSHSSMPGRKWAMKSTREMMTNSIVKGLR